VPTLPPPEVPAEFNLRTLIREQLATSEPDPHVIAERVAKLVPEDQLRVALLQVLPDFVRKVDVERRPAGHSIGDTYTAHADRSSPNGQPRSRWDDAGPWYKRLLARREYIDGTWKFFGDLTPEDLDAAALLRETTAARTAEEARKLREVARLARERGAKTVRALPAEVLAEVWQQ